MIKQLADATGRLRQQFPYLPQAFQLVRQSAGGLAIVWAAMLPLLPAGVAMALVLISIEVLQSIGKWVRTAQAERVQDHVHELIHQQALRLDPSFYDAPGYYDQLHRARIDALSRPAARSRYEASWTRQMRGKHN